jgi:MinD-like ATPase involved in chromosome partitioning or flagellar assembly
MGQTLGRIITFYSYKGGTGRSMALSNVAWILASNGYRVLLIDWDLEAPGLHRYLRPFLVDPELSSTPGLIDFVWDAARVSLTPTGSESSHRPQFPSLKDYVVGLKWNFRGQGSIKFIPAGQQNENYAQRVNTFDWDNFYERLGGGKLFHAERERLRASYDYVLIDSRTGVSDTSSICTVQMPDVLALFFTLNRQSIDGAAAVAASVTDAVQALRNITLPIYPVPTRIENAEKDKLDAAIQYSRRIFSRFLMHAQANRRFPDLDQQALYWKEVETPYDPYYAYEEVPAPFKDESGSRRGVLTPCERIAYWITDQNVSSLQPIADEDECKKVIEAYAFTLDETHGIKQNLTGGSQLADFLDRAIWQVVRRPREYCTFAVAFVMLFVALSLFPLLSRLDTLNGKLQSANTQLTSVNVQSVNNTAAFNQLKAYVGKLNSNPKSTVKPGDVVSSLNPVCKQLTGNPCSP